MSKPFTGPRVQLRTGRSRALWAGHPWVVEQSIRAIEGARVETGAVVQVVDHHGETIDFGLYSAGSSLPVRLLGIGSAWPEDWPRDQLPLAFWQARVARARRLRESFGLPSPGRTDCYRLLNSEGDGTPGFVVDVYGRAAVLHVTTGAAWALRETLLQALRSELELDGVWVQCDARSAELEGTLGESGVLWGTLPERLELIEEGVRYALAPGELQKTGHYLDQRDNRLIFGRLARGRSVLDAYCFAGSFALHAARGGATRVVAVDSSPAAIAAAQANATLNGDEAARIEWVRAKSEDWLRAAAEAGERFGLVSLDPPKLAPSRKSVEPALRKYEALCKQALRVLEPDGLLMVASCSSAIGADELRGALSAACAHARRTPRVLAVTHQPPDHPWPAAMREGLYLTAVLVQA